MHSTSAECPQGHAHTIQVSARFADRTVGLSLEPFQRNKASLWWRKFIFCHGKRWCPTQEQVKFVLWCLILQSTSHSNTLEQLSSWPINIWRTFRQMIITITYISRPTGLCLASNFAVERIFYGYLRMIGWVEIRTHCYRCFMFYSQFMGINWFVEWSRKCTQSCSHCI